MERLFDSFYREGTKVIIKLATGLDVQRNLFVFEFDVGNDNEAYAELLKNHLNQRYHEDKKAVVDQAVRFPTGIFTKYQLSDLKRWLRNNWDGNNNCIKRLKRG